MINQKELTTMQCSIRTVADMWKREGVQCEKEATRVLRHNGRLVSYRCDEHAAGKFLDSEYKVGPLPA